MSTVRFKRGKEFTKSVVDPGFSKGRDTLKLINK